MLIIRSANAALSELNTVDDNDDDNDDETLASRTTSQLLLCFRKMNPSKNTLLPRKRAAKGELVKTAAPPTIPTFFPGGNFTGTAATRRLYLH